MLALRNTTKVDGFGITRVACVLLLLMDSQQARLVHADAGARRAKSRYYELQICTYASTHVHSLPVY